MKRFILVAVTSLFALVACGGVAVPEFPPDPPAAVLGALGAVRVPSIGVDVVPTPLGLDENGQPAVPPESHVDQAGWYALGPMPGDVGPAVVVAHVGAAGVKGAFARLSEVKAGAVIEVQRGDVTLRFVVDSVQSHVKDQFPADLVYGNTPDAQLRLITCGGDLDTAEHSFKSNIIVFASLAT